MKKNLQIIGKMSFECIKKLLIAFTFYFNMVMCFAQQKALEYPKTIIIKEDTLIAFTISQTKKLSLINEENKMNKNIISINDLEINKKEEIIIAQKVIISNYQSAIDNYKNIIDDIKIQNSLNENITKGLKKEIRKQKIIKIVNTTVGFITTTLMTYLFITK